MDIKQYASRVKEYKLRVASRLRSVEGEKIKISITKQEKYVASTKYDGHFYTLIKEKDELLFINHRGKQITEHPIVKEAKTALKDIDQAIIPGELYLEGEERTRSFNVTKGLSDNDTNIKFAAFDLMELNGEYQKTTVFDRFQLLQTVLPNVGQLHVAHHEILESKGAIADMYKRLMDEGKCEGLVVKGLEPKGYKIKPKFTLDAVIVGFAEGDGDRAGLLRDFLLAFMREDGSYQIFAHMSHGFSDEQRKELLEEYKQKRVPSTFIEVARNKLAFHMVKPETVVEFSCLDVINEDSKGFIRKMNLSYDPEKGYTPNRLMQSVSVAIPLFHRFRDDKVVDAQDVRFAQVESIVSFESNKEEEEQLEPSTIMDRRVYTKESKGMTMVRKFIIAKTNKEHTESYPAYVYQYTDFSAGRAEPLKVDVKISSSEEQIRLLLDKGIEKNIKKGWELVE